LVAPVLLLLAVADAGASVRTFTGRCVGVMDGDSIEVHAGGAAIDVRLEGIDAPERGQPFSARAKQALSDLVFDRDVTVIGNSKDSYGRLVARVYVGAVDTSLELLRQGLAWHYTRYSTEEALANAQSVARARRVGLWADPAAVPPWAFRRPRTTASPPADRDSAPLAPDAPGEVHGNTQSRVYHRASCANYGCRNCTARFETAAAARAAGYRAAGCCHAPSR
jgi:endonuclease YncB( thermonuclease family)